MLDYKPYIPKTIDEVRDQLALMFAKSSTFKDSFFVGRNVDTVFMQLNEGLKNIREEIGNERHEALAMLSDQTRACFEADPDDSNGRARDGRKLVLEMRAIIEHKDK